ncbi:acyl-CoA synthetase [Brachybacterium phenoliresistens]|uniref:Acyl-CoA synthetase n=1 Tax=Brachybacterium phenoliresistens TaxID=396014 RepID=Z9JS95_9MICO|nr:AMP-binding protein [Brachybacterium phenoliresistens]EWS80622.1 acyl-CoA synthetase [Brachybacterium phenoliresistens]
MTALTLATVLRLRARLSPGSPVLVDVHGQLTAADLLDLARRTRPARHHRGVHAQDAGTPAPADVHLRPGPLREILAAVAAPGVRRIAVRSSGTTAAPRALARGPLSLTQLVLGLDLAHRLGMRPGRTIACAAPGEHGHGLSAAAGALALGMVLVDVSRLDMPAAHALLRSTAPDLITGVPVHLLDLARTGPLPIPRALSGSDVLTASMRQELLAAGIGRVHDVYGTTETGSLCVDGVPLRGVRIRERDGLLAVRSPFTQGRTVITDRGRIGSDGTVAVTGRADGRVSSGGLLHDPGAVRAFVAGLPGIAAVRLEVVPDARFGARTRGRIRIDPAHPAADGGDAAAAEVIRRVREEVRARFGAAAVPREILLEPGPPTDTDQDSARRT